VDVLQGIVHGAVLWLKDGSDSEEEDDDRVDYVQS
jgi:hypothetical protein